MREVFLIAKKDFQTYFSSPIAYIVIAVFLFLVGYMFFNLLSYFQQAQLQFMQIRQGAKPTIAEHIISPLFANINVVLLFVAPFITMRLLAEERKEQTIALLFTAPIRSISIILGKFFAGLGLIVAMLLGTVIYPFILVLAGNPDMGVILSSYLGVLLVAATYISVGLFWSTCTENQIVSAAMTFGTLLFFWLVGWSATQTDSAWGAFLEHLSIVSHFLNFSNGILTITDVVYYLSFISFAIFGTYTAFDVERWGSA